MTTEIRPATLHNHDGIRTPEQVRYEEAEEHYVDKFRENVDTALGKDSSQQSFTVDSRSLIAYLENNQIRFPHVVKKLRGESVGIILTRTDEEMRPKPKGFGRYEKERVPARWALSVAGANPKGHLSFALEINGDEPYQPRVTEKQGDEVLRTGIHTSSDLMFAKAVSEYVRLGVEQGVLRSWIDVSRRPIGDKA